jgi:cytolethal distending toxin subunit A
VLKGFRMNLRSCLTTIAAVATLLILSMPLTVASAEVNDYPGSQPAATSAIPPIHVRNVNSGLCITPDAARTDILAPIVQYRCDTSGFRYWEQVYVNASSFYLRNTVSTLCLTPDGGSAASLARMVQYYCDGHPSRMWQTYDAPGNGVWIENSWSHLCLTIDGGSTKEIARAVQYACDTHPARRWYL